MILSNARILPIKAAEYHKDPCETPSLSSSIANVLLSSSPLHAWARHPKLGARSEPDTSATTGGTLLHQLLLGGDGIEVIEAADFRSKAAQEARDRAISAGLKPILRQKYDEISDAAEIIKAKLTARGIEFVGQSEVVGTWMQGGVQCRCMIDHLILDEATIYDVKSITEADPRICARHVYDYGYHVQRAAYISFVEALRPDLVGRVQFKWLFAELDYPHDVIVATPDGAMKETGEAGWKLALQTWGDCVSSGNWPGRARREVMLETPPYKLAEHERKILEASNGV